MPLPKPPGMGQVPQPVRSYGGGQTFGDRGSNAANLGKGLTALFTGLANKKKAEKDKANKIVNQYIKDKAEGIPTNEEQALKWVKKSDLGDRYDWDTPESPGFQSQLQQAIAMQMLPQQGQQQLGPNAQTPGGIDPRGGTPRPPGPRYGETPQGPGMFKKISRGLGLTSGPPAQPGSPGAAALRARGRQAAEMGDMLQAAKMAQLQAQIDQSKGISKKEQARASGDISTLAMYDTNLMNSPYFRFRETGLDHAEASKQAQEFAYQAAGGINLKIAKDRNAVAVQGMNLDRQKFIYDTAVKKWMAAGGGDFAAFLDYEMALASGDDKSIKALGTTVAQMQKVVTLEAKQFQETGRHNKISEGLIRSGQELEKDRIAVTKMGQQLDFVSLVDKASDGQFSNFMELRKQAVAEDDDEARDKYTQVLTDILMKKESYQFTPLAKALKEGATPFQSITPAVALDVLGWGPFDMFGRREVIAPAFNIGRVTKSEAPEGPSSLDQFIMDLSKGQREYYETYLPHLLGPSKREPIPYMMDPYTREAQGR